MEKHELDGIIKRRYDAGKTLSIHKVTDEQYPYHVIEKAAKKYYGGWRSAKLENCGILSATHVTRADIEAKVAEIVSEGNEVNIKTLGKPYYHAIGREYGSLLKYRQLSGLDAQYRRWESAELVEEVALLVKQGWTLSDIRTQRADIYSAVNRMFNSFNDFTKETGVVVPRKSNRKYSDEELMQFVEQCHTSGLSGTKSKERDRKLFEACTKLWGNWNNALEANGYAPKHKSPRSNWTEDELKSIYLSELQAGIPRQSMSNQSAIRSLFGGITKLRKELGLEPGEIEYELISRISVDCYINAILKSDVTHINAELLDGLNISLSYSIKQHYGSLAEYFSTIDIDRYKKPYTPFTWTKENIVWQLERWIREGYPVNYTAIQSRHKGIIVACRRLFGSYEKAFEYAGLNYDDYRVDTAMASGQGREFERVVADILTDIGVEYLREPSINGCHPDFVVGKHWIDAKLSEWTVSFADCSTMHKYMPHCRKLSIVYLRQLKDETFRTNELGVDMVHVSELLKELPADKAVLYQRKLDAILDMLKENVA